VQPGPVNNIVVLSARPRERRLAEGIRSNLYKGVSSPLFELSVLRPDDIYHGLPTDIALLITTMDLFTDVPLVDSAFGKLQEGSVLSYDCPAKRPPPKPFPTQMPLFHKIATSATTDMRRGLEMEAAAVEEYCRVREVNHYPCGFLIHPDEEKPAFGLTEIKCPNVQSYVDCPYIKVKVHRH
ncbi:hypothetical protein LDENG_00176460, partial [Lucifuga dentata]